MNLLTKRLPTILAILLLLGLAAGLAWYWQNSQPVVAEELRPQKVRISNVADSKFTVSWVTSEKVAGKVEYGAVGQKLSEVAMDERDSGTAGQYRTHHVTVSGLQPSTQYAFRILSGENESRFDNNGSPYSVSTGRVISATPPAATFYGQVELSDGQAAAGAIVYVALPNAQVASTIVKGSGNYSIPIATIRSSDGNSYATYEASTTAASVTVEDGSETATATVLMANSAPVPTMRMGQTHDFRAAAGTNQPSEEVPGVAEVVAEPIGIFNVEPLAGSDGQTGGVKILNPGKEGEEVASTQPEFRGLAPKGAVLTITVHSSVPYSGTVQVDNDGTWEWTPPAELEDGEHTISIAYIDAQGVERTLTRMFTVSSALAQAGDPSFEATPSSTTKSPSPTPSLSPSPTASSTASASASPRVSNPSTESGVPVTGVFEVTLLTGLVGLVIMVLGAALLVL